MNLKNFLPYYESADNEGSHKNSFRFMSETQGEIEHGKQQH